MFTKAGDVSAAIVKERISIKSVTVPLSKAKGKY